MKKLSKEYIKSLIYEATGKDSRKLSKNRIKEIIYEEIKTIYEAK